MTIYQQMGQSNVRPPYIAEWYAMDHMIWTISSDSYLIIHIIRYALMSYDSYDMSI